MRAASTAWTVAGTRMLVDRAGQAVGAALADQRAGLDQRADALLQEERVALGPLDQQRLQRLDGRIVAEQRGQQLVGAGLPERVDPELGVVALVAPGVGVLRAVVDQQQDAGGRQALDQAVEQRLGLGVDPVQVLEDQQQRLLLALAQQQPAQRVERRRRRRRGGSSAAQAGVLDRQVEQRQQRRQDRPPAPGRAPAACRSPSRGRSRASSRGSIRQ